MAWPASQIEALEQSCRVYHTAPVAHWCHVWRSAGHRHRQAARRVGPLIPKDDDLVVPLQGELSQCRCETEPYEVASSLAAFWHPIWIRDSQAETQDIAGWPGFALTSFGTQCHNVQVDMLDLPANSAVGVCAWANSEIRMLSDLAVSDLMYLFHACRDQSFPGHLMQARVAVLSKVLEAQLPCQARPITIMSTLWRLCARVLTLQLLAQWGQLLPSSILAFLPGRSSLDLGYWLLHSVEEALLTDTAVSGFTLDLQKAVNNLPRLPCLELLRRMGVPSSAVEFWHKSLSKASTGLSEGCPASIMAMTDICLLFTTQVRHLLQLRTFVDNWTWLTDSVHCHAPAFQALDT